MREVAGFDPAETHENTPEEEAEYQLVLSRIQELAPDERDVLVMRYIEGLPVSVIAEALEEAPNTVSVRIHRALKKLRASLDLP